MFLKHVSSGHLVEVLDLQALFDPHKAQVTGRFNVGEDLPEPEHFKKARLVFPSGEDLPRCWCDPHYREAR
ncbi:MAG: acetyltransferase [Gammaproteobacteria bacterium]